MNRIKNEKGVVLIVSLVVIMVTLVLTGVFFSSLLTEKKATDMQKTVSQALVLSEAGANHGLAELRERIRSDTDLESLERNVSLEQDEAVFLGYVSAQNSLGLLGDYAGFEIEGNTARISVSTLDNLNTGIEGGYTANIIVEEDGNPSNPSGEIFIFPYRFTIEAQGQITTPDVQRDIRLLQGSFTVTVRRDTFARFALFTAHHRMESGQTVWFTGNTNFTGPVHTNERFSFANNPSGHFTEETTQHETRARFYNDGWPRLLDADSNPPDDVPTFEEGFERGADIINLVSSITQTELRRQALGGTSEPGSNGIYVPNDGVNVIGGIYIRGNQGVHSDDPIINMGLDGNNNPVYTITRASTTSTITVDYTNNQTTVQAGGAPVTYQGIPDGIDNEGILIYANDDIGSFSGTVQGATQITVSSERDIVVTNHVLYQNFNPSPLNAEGYTNVLGILSWGGDVRIGTTAPDNINIHGVVMAPHGVFSVDNYNVGSPRGTATLLGGVISDFYGAFGTFSGTTQRTGYGRNFVYDPRMLEGIAPPYFPYMSNFTCFDDGGLDNKLVWQDQGV